MITHISTRHDFSSLYFYRKLHLFMNFSLTKLQWRVSFFSIRLIKSQKGKYKQQIQMQKSYVSVKISFSLHLIKFQKESWQIQNWLQPVSAHYWLEKTVEPRRKWKWFGHKNHLIWTQKVFVQPWDSFAAALVFDLRRIHMFSGICYWETNICEYWWIFAYNWIHIKGSLNDF